MKSKRGWGCARLLGGVVLGLGLVLVGGYAVATQNPEVGAKAAMVLRSIIGDQAVAQLETVVYAIKDTFNQARRRPVCFRRPPIGRRCRRPGQLRRLSRRPRPHRVQRW